MLDEEKVLVPPIKCQGIKTKLVPFIAEHFSPSKGSTWVEPFMGSGVVAFNILPEKAVLCDKNQHIINLYTQIQEGKITSEIVREFLVFHGQKLREGGADYYRFMRNEFNSNHDPLYFLFLNRSDFNGMIRFSKNGNFNVPFCQKPDRFAPAYVTKIVNQVKKVEKIIKEHDWKFVCCDWREAFKYAGKGDYIYLDPPYIGRDTSYVGEWPIEDAVDLAKFSHETEANVCLSMWKENEFRKNDHLFECWSDFEWFEQNHFYHFGGKEDNRHPMIEILAIKMRS